METLLAGRRSPDPGEEERRSGDDGFRRSAPQNSPEKPPAGRRGTFR